MMIHDNRSYVYWTFQLGNASSIQDCLFEHWYALVLWIHQSRNSTKDTWLTADNRSESNKQKNVGTKEQVK